MAAFAELTEAQRERLEMLIEEAGEIVQIGCKVLRHGYESFHPDDVDQTENRELLEHELADLLTVMGEMVRQKDIFEPASTGRNAWDRKSRFTHHQDDSPPDMRAQPEVDPIDEIDAMLGELVDSEGDAFDFSVRGTVEALKDLRTRLGG